MPLVRVELRNNYSLGAIELYRNVNKDDPKELLEGVAVAGLVGLLRQLGDLVEFATEVFHGLQEDVAVTSSRSRKLMARVRRIEAAVSPLEKAILAQRSHLHLAYTAGSSWHTRVRCLENHLTCSDMPRFIMDSYEGCRSPPRLDLLDRFDPSGPGSCLKRYSNPTFFKRESAVPGEMRVEKIPKYKDRKIMKRSSRPRSGGASQDASLSYHSGRVGEHTPSQTTSAYEATLTSYSIERSILYSRNGSDCIESDLRPSYSIQPEQLDSRESINSPLKRYANDFLDYTFPEEKLAKEDSHEQKNRDGVTQKNYRHEKDKTRDPMSEYVHDALAEEDDNKNLESTSPTFDLTIFNDEAVNSGAVDKICVHKVENSPMLEEHQGAYDGLREAMGNNVRYQSSMFESNDLAESSPVNAHGEINADANVSSGNGETSNGSNVDYITGKVSSSNYEDGRAGVTIIDETNASKYSSASSFTFWTNGGLLGLEPSKPQDSKLLDSLSRDEEINSSNLYGYKDVRKLDPNLKNTTDGCDTEGDPCPKYQKSGASFRNLSRKIPPTDLDIKFGNFLVIGTNKNLLPGEDEKCIPSGHQSARTFETRSQQIGHNQVFSGRKTNPFDGESPIPLPPSSPPLRCMKISFLPINGVETSKLKLKFPDGNTNNNGCANDLFSSFQLVPEASIAPHNVGSDSDDDTFCRSSPSLSDGHHSFRSESNSDQWDSNESTTGKDHELHDALDRISLSESAIPKNVKATLHEDINKTDGRQFPPVEKAHEKSQSCRSVDQNLDALSHLFPEELTSCSNSMDGVRPQLASALPPMPPIQWRNMNTNRDLTENKSMKMPEGFKCTLDHNNTVTPKISQQPKPAPVKESNGLGEGKQGKRTGEEDFLHQIRTKAFNLRPTVTRKPAPTSNGSTNVQVTEILKKANAIRRAVGGEGGEDSNWSDS